MGVVAEACLYLGGLKAEDRETMTLDHVQIKEAVAEISRIVEAHSGGQPDDAAKQAIETQCSRIEQAGASTGYFAEKLGDIRDHADSLYSARKHQEHGTQQLVVWILGAADNIEHQASLHTS